MVGDVRMEDPEFRARMTGCTTGDDKDTKYHHRNRDIRHISAEEKRREKEDAEKRKKRSERFK